MCKHVCSNKIVYFTTSLPAVASLFPTNVSVVLFLNGYGEFLQHFSFTLSRGWLCTELPSSA